LKQRGHCLLVLSCNLVRSKIYRNRVVYWFLGSSHPLPWRVGERILVYHPLLVPKMHVVRGVLLVLLISVFFLAFIKGTKPCHAMPWTTMWPHCIITSPFFFFFSFLSISSTANSHTPTPGRACHSFIPLIYVLILRIVWMYYIIHATTAIECFLIYNIMIRHSTM